MGHPDQKRWNYTLADFILRHRATVLVICLLVVAAIGSGAVHLRFSSDSRAFFGKDNPERIALDRMEQTYSRAGSAFFLILPKDGDLFTGATLKAIAEMTTEAWQVPDAARVSSLANFNHTRAEGDEIITEPLYETDTQFTPERISRIRDISFSEPELLHRLTSPDGDATGISVQLLGTENETASNVVVVEYLRKLQARWANAYPHLTIKLTGSAVAGLTFKKAAQRDTKYLVPLTAILIFGLIAFGLRSLSITVATTVIMSGGAIGALGFAGWSGMELTAVMAPSPLAVMVLTIASCIHVVLTWLHHRAEGLEARAALLRSLGYNIPPVTVTNLTTVIGFLCMNFSSAPPLRDMGNFVAFGLIVGWLLSLTALPCLLSYLRATGQVRLSIPVHLMHGVADFSIRFRRLLVALFLGGIVLAAVGIDRIVLDDDYVRYFDHSFEFRRDTDFMEKRLTGMNALQFSLESKKQGGVFEPAFLEKVDRFAAWLEEQNKVVYVNSLPKLLKRLNRSMNGGGQEQYRLAETREHNAQYLLFYEMSLPAGHDLNAFIDVDRSKTLLSVVVRQVSSQDVRDLAESAEHWLRQNAPDLTTRASGVTVVFAHISERNIKSMIGGTLLALVLISGILLLVVRSVKFGLLSLIPNLYPAFLAFGIWGLAVSSINLASSVVTAITFGIVVDDTVHILMKYLHLRRWEGKPPREAIRGTLATVGSALVVTSVGISLGFLAIGMSGFQINQHIGLLTSLVVMVALIADLLLLPPLLLLAEKGGLREPLPGSSPEQP